MVLSFVRARTTSARNGRGHRRRATGGCDGILILSPNQQGYSQDTVTFIRVRKTARRPFPDPLPHHVPSITPQVLLDLI
jgi:hypothetical protein